MLAELHIAVVKARVHQSLGPPIMLGSQQPWPMVPPICLLPMELLSIIFELHCTDATFESLADHHRRATILSHVCCQFRAVALATPQIWTVITSDLTPEQIRVFLARSKAAKLIVTFTPTNMDASRSDFREFITLLMPHHTRWLEFQYLITSSRDAKEELAAIELFPSTIFPSLLRLELHAFNKRCDPISISGFEAYFSTWSTPNLAFFKSKNILPKLRETRCLSQCRLDLYLAAGSRWNPNVLEDSPSLEKLCLNFWGYDVEVDPEGAYPLMNLSNLKTLVIVVGSGVCASIGAPFSFLRSLRAPKLASLSMKCLHSTVLISWMKALFTYDTFTGTYNCPSLRSVEITVYRGDLQGQEVFDILSGLGNLRELRIQCTNDLVIPENIRLPIFPTLISLELWNCDSFSDQFVSEIKEKHLKSSVSGNFSLTLVAQYETKTTMRASRRFRKMIGDRYRFLERDLDNDIWDWEVL